jgi:hypothetical protein
LNVLSQIVQTGRKKSIQSPLFGWASKFAGQNAQIVVMIKNLKPCFMAVGVVKGGDLEV